MASSFSSDSRHRLLPKSIEFFALRTGNNRQERVLSADSESAQLFLVFVSRAGGFDQACGFATALAGLPIFDELRKLRFGQDSQKLIEASALCENCLQGPPNKALNSRHGAQGAQILRTSP